ncbi:unnamed protein product [Amoebophrya sp. A25]|nr:unnamed protein product [Amoebophrya sp. A25]|eukprot:GSA25T00025275001.1
MTVAKSHGVAFSPESECPSSSRGSPKILSVEIPTKEDYHPKSPGLTMFQQGSGYQSGFATPATARQLSFGKTISMAETPGMLSPKKSLQKPTFSSAASPAKSKFLSKMRVLFNRMDTNGDGTIDFDEFLNFFASIGKDSSMRAVRDIFKVYDADRSGAIDFDEFSVLMESVMSWKMPYGEALGEAEHISVDMMAESLGGLAKLGKGEAEWVEAEACALSPMGTGLKPVSLAQLRATPFFYALGGGFVCQKCKISSDNLCDKTAWYTSDLKENYLICGMCANLQRKENIAAMTAMLTEQKKQAQVKAFLPSYLMNSPSPSPKSRGVVKNVVAPLGPQSRVTQAYASTLLEEG